MNSLSIYLLFIYYLFINYLLLLIYSTTIHYNCRGALLIDFIYIVVYITFKLANGGKTEKNLSRAVDTPFPLLELIWYTLHLFDQA